VCGNKTPLRRSLEALDSAFETRVQGKILQEIQRAMSACQVAYPGLVERLRQHISVRALQLGLPTRRVRAALGGASVKNAYFWRLYARSVESSHEPMGPVLCALWEQFRRHAVAEGWFGENGPEAAALYLHMAELLLQVPVEMLETVQSKFAQQFSGFENYYEDQPPAIRAVEAKYKKRDLYFLSPNHLFERACSIDPHREAFEQWLNWARQESGWRVAADVAERWHQAIPNHSQPLLYLMESAEKRGALKKATAFLEQAQKLDAVNPEVRRAALRLLVAQTGRHLQQRKPHLVEQDLAALEALPQAQVADRPAFLVALHWACEVIRGDAELASRFLTQISRLLGSSAAAILDCESAGALGQLTEADLDHHLRQRVSLDPADSLVSATARVCVLSDDLGAPFTIPTAWCGRLLQELTNAHGGLDGRELEILGRAALRTNQKEVAYAASVAGLKMGSDTEARFLLLRARALPEWEFERRDGCIKAAVELGRRRRDTSVINEAVELRRGRRNTMTDFFACLHSEDWHDFSMTTEQIQAVLQREKGSGKFPSDRSAPFRVSLPRETVFLDDENPEDDDEPFTLDDMARLVAEMSKARGRRQKRVGRDLPGQGDLF
jgi:tetratricopeptide (TPR) repeat protein